MVLDIDKKTQLRDYLNANLEDPLSPSRSGLHFYTDEDAFNLNRGDTLPKGIITKITTQGDPKSFGEILHQNDVDVFGIWYYVKAGQRYTRPDTSAIVQEQGFAGYMRGRIKEAFQGDTRSTVTFGAINRVEEDSPIPSVTSPNGKISMWRVLVTVEINSMSNG